MQIFKRSKDRADIAAVTEDDDAALVELGYKVRSLRATSEKSKFVDSWFLHYFLLFFRMSSPRSSANLRTSLRSHLYVASTPLILSRS